MGQALSADLLRKMNAYWRAANYLSVGQIYLLDNPLLKEPLTLQHVKPRLLGHWGTTPGLNFIYVHLNRVIQAHDLDVIYIAGPGHGGPGLVANVYLEGTYSEVYPEISPDEEGMKKLFKQFSFPGGIPSHVAPETPGSIHEGGELGYSLSHAYGAAFDNPDLIVACVVGDGEAETGPLATGWHGNKFLNPATDGAVLPILHLNGYKIANPTLLARIGHDELDALMRGYGYTPFYVEGHDPEAMHQKMAETLDAVVAEIQHIQADARSGGEGNNETLGRGGGAADVADDRAAVAEGLDGAKGSGRQTDRRVVAVASGAVLRDGGQAGASQAAGTVWMKSYKAEELFDKTGALTPELAELAPTGLRRMGANPHANGGLLLRDLRLPDFCDYAVAVPKPGGVEAEATRVLGGFLRDVMKRNADHRNFRLFRTGRDGVEPARGRDGGDRQDVDGRGRPHRRPPVASRPRDGGAERAPVSGLAGGLSPHRPPRPLLLLRGLHPHHRLDVQPARQMAQDHAAHPVAAADRLADVPAHVARLAAGPQRLLAPGPRIHRPRRQQEGRRDPRLLAAGRQHAACRSATTACAAATTST